MKKVLATVMFLALCAAGVFIYPQVLKEAFALSGRIEMTPRLARLVDARPNMQCFIIVKNAGDIPVAVKQVVNPRFPMNFTIDKSDLTLSDASKGPFKVEVQVNTHGEAGSLKAGDMFGNADVSAIVRANNVCVTVDKMMGVPRLVADYKDNSMRIFKYAAR
ncbi:MAG: hypothetical protein PHW69_07900 [Elusimicrobiaceae bacterium]|nr:hypothetical protein [Elusimicrobiaceae bacterium]